MDRQTLAGDIVPFADAPAGSAALVTELFDWLDDWTARYARARAVVGKPARLAQGPESECSAARRRVDAAFGELATACYADRRHRDRVFEGLQVFGEPAWDILLDVASAEARGERLQITSVCIGACVPETTALRWIGVLEKRGLLRREHDLADQRRSFVRLTAEGARRLQEYFSSRGPLRPTGSPLPLLLND